MNSIIFRLIAIGVALVALSVQAHAAKIYKKYHYYTISGRTAAELDHSLTRNGPYLKSTGSHHPGATELRFDPHVEIQQEGRYCKVKAVRVDIQADIKIPKWKQRSITKSKELALIWDVLSRDIKRHEESHVVIAREHASKIERHIRSLPYRKDCTRLKQDIDLTAMKILAHHDEAQKRFDQIEAKNFERRFTRLLVYRLQNLNPKPKS